MFDRLLAGLLVAMAMLDTLFTIDALEQPLFKYHTHAQLKSFLGEAARSYPGMTEVYAIGNSTEGRELLVISISGTDPKKHVPLRPKVKYVGNIHGNEAGNREMLIHLIHHLLKNYNTNDTIKNFLDETEVHILVSMNPDGFADAMANSADSAGGICYGYIGRFNKNGVDLNRNFPDHFIQNNNKREAETTAIMDWNKAFILCAGLHEGALVANYPYDNYENAAFVANYSASNDDDLFRYLARKFSFTHKDMSKGRPCSISQRGFPEGITNGAAWYPVSGGMQDYSYIEGNCVEITVELGCCKFPRDGDLVNKWNASRDALINYLMSVHMGVKGTVIDAVTQKPIAAADVFIVGRHHPRHTTQHGEFWSLLLPGEYTLRITRSGYNLYERRITVRSSVTTMEVKLTPKKTKAVIAVIGAAGRLGPSAGHLLIVAISSILISIMLELS